MKRSLGSILIMIMLATAAYAQALPPVAEAEIMHLLDFISASECEFYRNGVWYTADEARAHLERKYRYLLRKQMITSAEDFIARAATESSISGEAYKVSCDKSVSTSEDWLSEELKRLRDKRASP